jgi:hypothetical protein
MINTDFPSNKKSAHRVSARAMISALHVSLFAGLKRALPSLQPGTFRQALRWAGRALRHSSIDTIASIRCGVPLI